MIIEAFPDESLQVGMLDLPGTTLEATINVYLHGLGASSCDIFRDIVSQPSLRTARSLLIDLPGFGHSTASGNWSYSMEAQADLVARLLHRLEVTKVTLIGHSMGGSISIALAWRRPDLVDRLIVAEPNLDPGLGDLSAHIARQTEDRFFNRGYAALVYQTQRQAARRDRVAARFLVTLKQASPVALHRGSVSLLAERDPTFREIFESLTIPRATITGDRTPPVAPPLSDPEITHFIVENAGHLMMIDNPSGFATALRVALKM